MALREKVALLCDNKTHIKAWKNQLNSVCDLLVFQNCFDLFFEAQKDPRLIPACTLIIDTQNTPNVQKRLAERGAIRVIATETPQTLKTLKHQSASFVQMDEFQSWTPLTREQKAEELIKFMVRNADHDHKDKLFSYAEKIHLGISLLEDLQKALDESVAQGTETPKLGTYINRSPQVVKKILEYTLSH